MSEKEADAIKNENEIRKKIQRELGKIMRVPTKGGSLSVEISMRIRNTSGRTMGMIYGGRFKYDPKEIKELQEMVANKVFEIRKGQQLED